MYSAHAKLWIGAQLKSDPVLMSGPQWRHFSTPQRQGDFRFIVQQLMLLKRLYAGKQQRIEIIQAYDSRNCDIDWL